MKDTVNFEVPSFLSHVTVKRSNRGTVRIAWQPDNPEVVVSIFQGIAPDMIDRSSPLVRVKGETGVDISGLDPSVRYYFELMPQEGKSLLAAERQVPFQGAVNFRDLGGYQTGNGGRVRWGRIFRSDHLSRLTDRDQGLIRNMGIRLVCDFRTLAEARTAPDRLPGDHLIEYVNLPILNGDLDPSRVFEKVRHGDVSWLTNEFLITMYREIIDESASVWATVFHRLAQPESLPLVFHCTGGKDRSGVCAALILLSLGVSEETVIYDYGLSDVYNAPRLEELYKEISSFGIPPEKIAPYLTVPRFLIVFFLRHLRETYGSAVKYLTTIAGVSEKTVNQLRQNLLD
ncbi:MAG: tyrosine-protein phosphatase [Deltaproteobacteria bacterium]|nr:tyrosine-protein phosphatase [Deltaproteobacteria bacterium]